jgi:3-phosphoshikimate 1-carboxyvinyltransferase
LTGCDVVIDSSQSSQFASALMMIGPMLPDGLLLTAQDPVSDGYLDLTVQVMVAFGAVIRQESVGGHRIFRIGHGMNPPSVYRVPQDVSGAAFLWLAGVAGPVPIGVAVDRDGGHPDLAFLDCLEAMGADVSTTDGVTIVGGDLRQGGSFDLSDFPDSACALGIAAAINPEPVTIHGAAHLRLKESDRISAMVEGLRALGLDATARHDGFRVEGATVLRDGCILPSHDDHRIAMAFATLGVRHAITIDGAECVDKSFPEFFDVLRSVAKVERLEPQS